MMKIGSSKTYRKILILFSAVLIFGLGMIFANAAPGDSSDPMVTKSYVDKKIAFAPLHLSAGQTLICGEGAEIILRSGEAAAVAGGTNGISDLTSGADILNGRPVSLNHHLLVPRADGRGIKTSTEAWVLIRGEYKLQ